MSDEIRSKSEELSRIIDESDEVRAEKDKRIAELAETIQSHPPYNSASFQCLHDYRSCTNVEFSYVCATFMVVCLAERVIPLAGD